MTRPFLPIPVVPFAALLGVACATPIAEKSSAIDNVGENETLAELGSDDRADRVSSSAEIVGSLSVGGRLNGRFGARPQGFAVALARGQRFTARLLGASRTDPVLSLYGPLETSWGAVPLVARNDDDGRSLNSKIERSVRLSGTYLLVATELFGGTGNFTLTTECLGDACAPVCSGPTYSCPTGSECHVTCFREPCPGSCHAITPPSPIAICTPTDCRGPAPRPAPVVCEDGSLITPTVTCSWDRASTGCIWQLGLAICPPLPD